MRKQLSIYFSTYFLNAALSFGTVVLLTHYLDKTYDYGIITLYSSFLIFLAPFISGGILYPLSVEYFKRKGESYSDYFTNAQIIPVISVFLFTLVCFIFQEPLMRFLKVPAIWIWIMPVTAWFIMINETVMLITRNNNKPWQFAFFSVGKNLLEIGLTILLVVGMDWAWEGRLFSATVAPSILGIFSIYLFSRWRLIAKKIDWSVTRQIALLCIPYVFERLTVFVLGYSDRYFIDKFDKNGTNEVGLYGLGSQFAMIIFIVVVSLNSAYQPYLFKRMSEGFKGRIHKSTWWYILFCAATTGILFLAIPLLFKMFIGASYQAAKPYAYILCGGYFMWGIYNAFQTYLIYMSKSRVILLISAIGMVTSLVLNFILVPEMGAQGAAITSVIVYSLMAIICFLFVNRYFISKE